MPLCPCRLWIMRGLRAEGPHVVQHGTCLWALNWVGLGPCKRFKMEKGLHGLIILRFRVCPQTLIEMEEGPHGLICGQKA